MYRCHGWQRACFAYFHFAYTDVGKGREQDAEALLIKRKSVTTGEILVGI